MSKYLFTIGKYMQASSKPPSVKTKLQILDRTQLNHNCYVYKFKWAGPSFKLATGQHLKVIEKITTDQAPQGQEIVRKYMPIQTSQNQVNILMKMYGPEIDPKYAHMRRLTEHIKTLKIGDTINVKGPYGKFGYKQGGIIVSDGIEMKKKRIFFIVGGSAIAPIYKTIKDITAMKQETIQIILLLGNKKEEDILFRKQLAQLQPRIKVYFSLIEPTEGWEGLTGIPSNQLLSKVFPLDDRDTFYTYCGPVPMQNAMKELFSTHYPQSSVLNFQ